MARLQHVRLRWPERPLSERFGFYLACYIEDQGWQAVPHSAHTIWNYNGRPKTPESVGPEVCVTLYYAAAAAGLGEMGWSKVFLNPEYGPMLRYALVITDAPYEPDPLFEGQICNRCKKCVKACPAGAIHPTETESVEIGGKIFENAKLDQGACLFHHWGLSSKTSPFLPEGAEAEFKPGMTMEDVVILREEVNKKVPIYNRIRADSRTQAICGSRGCGAVCVRHLEEHGLIEKTMNQFTCQKEEQAEKATITHLHVFLADEPVPPHFLQKCREEANHEISEHVEGVG